MFMYTCIYIIITVGFCYIRGPSIIEKTIKDNVSSLSILTSAISKNHKTKTGAIVATAKVLATSLYISVCQTMNKTVKRLPKNKYEVAYTINGRLYKMIVKPIRGPSLIEKIVDEGGVDIMLLVIPYLGPRNDFHGTPLTPKFFGKKEIQFTFVTGKLHCFGEKTPIKF
jgi:hypothetical protein